MSVTPYVVYQDGLAKIVTFVKAYGQHTIYMANGSVFSKSTGKQLPYSMHPGITCSKVSK